MPDYDQDLEQIRQHLEAALQGGGRDVSVSPLRPVADDPSRVEVDVDWRHHQIDRYRLTAVARVENLHPSQARARFIEAMRQTEADWESGANPSE